MPHECPCWRPKKAENITSTCILLYQPRLGCFLNKFLAKWQVSWKMQVGLQPTTETMWTAEGIQVGKEKQKQTNNPKKITAFRDTWKNRKRQLWILSSFAEDQLDILPCWNKKRSHFLYFLHSSSPSLQICPSCFQFLFLFLIPLFFSHFLFSLNPPDKFR